MVIRTDPNANYQTINGARHAIDPNANYMLVNGRRIPIGLGFSTDNTPDYGGGNSGIAAAPTPPQYKFTFDTIGQVIFRSIGHCRLPLRTIWAQGITKSGDVSISNTQTFAAALCAPIDPLEEGEIFAIWAGGSLIFNSSGAVTPEGWSTDDASLLAASLASAVIFPGDETQVPASLIVADKGADKTNAFRGIRYIILQNYPIGGGGSSGGSGIPPLSLGWLRTSDGGTPTEPEGAVAFLDGAS